MKRGRQEKKLEDNIEEWTGQAYRWQAPLDCVTTKNDGGGCHQWYPKGLNDFGIIKKQVNYQSFIILGQNEYL